MYNIYYSMKDSGWDDNNRRVVADTILQAFMEAARIVRELLSTREVEFLPVSQTEFVIWAFGTCKGYLQVKEVGPETSAQGLGGG